MAKIIWAIGIILMIMSTAAIVSASESKGEAQPVVAFAAGTEGVQQPVADASVADANSATKGTVDSKAAKSFTSTNIPGQANPTLYWSLPQLAWGRYGPVSLGQGLSAYYRIYYGGSFSRYPAVTDTLNVRYPSDIYTVYSLGDDAGYTYLTSFDARLRTYSGSLTNAYIDWQAIG